VLAELVKTRSELAGLLVGQTDVCKGRL
jgi:hypothetical protein